MTAQDSTSLSSRLLSSSSMLGRAVGRGLSGLQNFSKMYRRSLEEAARDNRLGVSTREVLDAHEAKIASNQEKIEALQMRWEASKARKVSIHVEGDHSLTELLRAVGRGVKDEVRNRVDHALFRHQVSREIHRTDREQDVLFARSQGLQTRLDERADALELTREEKMAMTPTVLRAMWHAAVDMTAEASSAMLQHATDATLNNIDRAVNFTYDKASKASDAVKAQLSRAGDATMNGIDRVANATYEKAGKATDATLGGIDRAVNFTYDKASKASDAVKAQLSRAGDATMNGIDRVANVTYNKAGEVTQGIANRFSAMFRRASKATHSVGKLMEKTINQAVERVDQALAQKSLDELRQVGIQAAPVASSGIELKSLMGRLQSEDAEVLKQAKLDAVTYAGEHKGDLSLTRASQLGLAVAKVCAKDQDVHTTEDLAAQWKHETRLQPVVQSLYAASHNFMGQMQKNLFDSLEPEGAKTFAQQAPQAAHFDRQEPTLDFPKLHDELPGMA